MASDERVLFPRPGDRFIPGHRLSALAGNVALIGPQLTDVNNGQPFPGELAVDDWMHVDESDPSALARAAAIAAVIDRVHEVLEWTTVEGERLADPHPGCDEEGMWGWLAAQVGDLLDNYAAGWPARAGGAAG